MSPPTWRAHLPTVDATHVRLRLRPRGERDPWAFMLAVTELQRAGAVGEERFRSVGAGRGEPLLASQPFRWLGCALLLEARCDGEGGGEICLELPCWDELAESQATEDDLWELVDALAAAVGAGYGALGDGEPLDDQPGNHLGLLLPLHLSPPTAAADGARAALYRELPQSGLGVFLR